VAGCQQVAIVNITAGLLNLVMYPHQQTGSQNMYHFRRLVLLRVRNQGLIDRLSISRFRLTWSYGCAVSGVRCDRGSGGIMSVQCKQHLLSHSKGLPGTPYNQYSNDYPKQRIA
jgi:hypothetical protein